MTEIRPMLEADVAEASLLAFNALRDMADVYTHEEWPRERSPERVVTGDYRVDHIRRHDPAGSWVATEGDLIVGVALAIKRESIWFLSLLTVSTEAQGAGTGRKLLDAALSYAADCSGAWIMSSTDPKALRRYHQAGFAIHPGYDLKGDVDRSLLPATPSYVAEADLLSSADFVDDLGRMVRGCAYGPDLEALAARGDLQLLRAERGGARGFVLYGPGEIWNLAATDPGIATDLVLEATARGANPSMSFGAITAQQQWAIDVGMRMRLGFAPGTSLCFRGTLGPMTPLIANGAYG